MHADRTHSRGARTGRGILSVDRWALLVAIPIGLGIVLLGLPIGSLIGQAILDGQLLEVVQRGVILNALALSVVTTAISISLIALLGTPLALFLARRRPPGTALLETLIDLPIVLPPSVAGLALLFAFGRLSPAGQALELFGIVLPYSTAAVILAQTFVAAPFYIRSARAGFLSVDRDIEDAARIDGASEFAVFRRITVALAGPAVTAGLVMAWARALGEFGATIMFAGNITGRTQTLPLVVYSAFQSDLDASVAAAAILVLAAIAVLLAVRLTRWRSALDARGLG